jgi:hypothetical protein
MAQHAAKLPLLLVASLGMILLPIIAAQRASKWWLAVTTAGVNQSRDKDLTVGAGRGESNPQKPKLCGF